MNPVRLNDEQNERKNEQEIAAGERRYALEVLEDDFSDRLYY